MSIIKSILAALWTRVFVHYESTFVGLGFVAADVLFSTLSEASIPPWAHVVVGICASLLALAKGKVQAPPPAMMLLVATSLGLSGCALFRPVPPLEVLIPAEVSTCGPGAVALFVKVADAVKSENYIELIDALAVDAPAEVTCIVDVYVASRTPESAQQAIARAYQNQDVELARAIDWREQHP
jgi:hypothetical protein